MYYFMQQLGYSYDKSVWKYYNNTKIIVNWTDGYVVF